MIWSDWSYCSIRTCLRWHSAGVNPERAAGAYRTDKSHRPVRSSRRQQMPERGDNVAFDGEQRRRNGLFLTPGRLSARGSFPERCRLELRVKFSQRQTNRGQKTTRFRTDCSGFINTRFLLVNLSRKMYQSVAPRVSNGQRMRSFCCCDVVFLLMIQRWVTKSTFSPLSVSASSQRRVSWVMRRRERQRNRERETPVFFLEIQRESRKIPRDFAADVPAEWAHEGKNSLSGSAPA